MNIIETIRNVGLTAFGNIQLQTDLPKVRATHCRKVLKLAQEGDIILRKYDYFLDGKFIPGEFTHSGIVESPETSHCSCSVIHAVAEGVERIDLLDFVKDADNFALLRPIYRFKEDAEKAIIFARKQVGKSYDFGFDVESDLENCVDYFCHKLPASALYHVGIKLIPILKSIGPITHEIFTGDTFLQSKSITTIYIPL